ncbi:hypothetical protein MY04_1844 [Flammeovirga sp. MY04]|nr:hypothetical protein MY04_1844 [Flammeovirga sp. MY04]
MKLSSSTYYYLFLIGLISIIQGCASVNIREYENASIKFMKSSPLPQPRAYMGYCSNGTSCFVVGGENKSGDNFDNVLVFNVDKEQWNELTPVNITAEKNINSIIANGSLLLLNGNENKNDEDFSDVDENVREISFNVQVPYLNKVSENPEPLYKNCLAEYKNMVYSFGGMIDEDTYSNTLYSYDPKKKKWKQLASMPIQMVTFGAAVNGKIYTFGGKGDKEIDDIFMYNMKVNRWVKVGKLPEPITDAAVTQFKDYIILFSERQLFIFDTAKGSLKRFQTNIGDLRGMGATVSKEKLIIFGGIKTSGSGKSNYSSTVYMIDLGKVLKG